MLTSKRSRTEEPKADRETAGTDLLAAALDAVAETVVLLDGERRVCYVSERIVDLVGVAPADLLGKQLGDVVGATRDLFAEPAAVTAGARAAYARPGEPRECDLRLSDGRTLICRSIPVGEGGVFGRVFLVSDVTLVRSHETRIQAMIDGLAVTEEREWRGRAAELRDGMLQSFSAALLRLDALAAAFADAPHLAEEISAIVSDLRAQCERTHALLNLDPEAVGLAGAVELLLEQFSAETAVPTDLEGEALPRFPAGVELVAFQVVREVLDRVRDHAGAESVGVRLSSADGLRCEILAGGPGLQAGFLIGGAASATLEGARRRVELAGGQLEVAEEPGRGARVRFSLPADPE